MAHKTRINGTNYGIKGGKCRVNGTNYSIKKGRTLVGGTGYNISFTIPLSITGNGTFKHKYSIKTNTVAFVTVNGNAYSSAATVNVAAGTTITCTVRSYESTAGKIYLNGTAVATSGTISRFLTNSIGDDYKEVSYTYTVTKAATIALTGSGYNENDTSNTYGYGTIHITG